MRSGSLYTTCTDHAVLSVSIFQMTDTMSCILHIMHIIDKSEANPQSLGELLVIAGQQHAKKSRLGPPTL